MRAIVADKEESAWDLIDDSYAFEFSLWKNSRFRVEKKAKKGAESAEFIEGNYLSIDRNTARISYADPEDSQTQDRASVKQGCTSFIKYHVDRLGRMHQVKREVRTWRGGVCT
jgi:CRISPR-associated endonuclease Csn1